MQPRLSPLEPNIHETAQVTPGHWRQTCSLALAQSVPPALYPACQELPLLCSLQDQHDT